VFDLGLTADPCRAKVTRRRPVEQEIQRPFAGIQDYPGRYRGSL